eukprot:COSAG05_NODE_500_length_9234_cov_107.281664_19_plen_69_part_00
MFFKVCAHISEDDDLPMSERWANIPNSLSYTLILLSGDYPLIEFTLAGRFVNGIMILCAQVCSTCNHA